jgi:hypothetical protein
MSRSFERKRKAWLRDAIERHQQEAAIGARRARERDVTLRMEWLERGEWVVRRGPVNLAWFRTRDEAEAYMGARS